MPLPVILQSHDADCLFHLVWRQGGLFPPFLPIAGNSPAAVIVENQAEDQNAAQITEELRHSAQCLVSMETDGDNCSEQNEDTEGSLGVV